MPTERNDAEGCDCNWEMSSRRNGGWTHSFFHMHPSEWTHASAPGFPCRFMSSHSHHTHEISKDTSQRNDGIDNDSKHIYKYVAVAAYFRVFVLLRDARFCVDASPSALEEALELGGAGAPDAGAFKMSDGPDSSDFAERSGDADGRRFCGVDLISAFTLGRATPTPPFDISSSSLQNPSGKSAFLGALWASMKASAFFGPATSPSKSKMRLMPRIIILT